MERKRLQQISLDNHIVKRKRTGSDDDESMTVRRAGTVNKIILKNFMCHSMLEVTFEKNINYISGRNGSGKSAILTALVVGLGAKATITNRGSSIKDFIKTGKNSASIEITLNNHGQDAYRPSVYGKEITIIRNFTAGGSSSYKIKSASGLIISTHSRDIHRITSYMNIQIDNPVCVLNQDTSRTFLSTSDPKQKFNLFIRATKLEMLHERYQHIRDNKENTLRIFEEKKKVHEDLNIELASLKEKLDNHASVTRLIDKKMVLQREHLWAKVKNAEKLVSEKEKVVEKLRQTHARILDNCENRVQRLEEVKQRVGELQQQILQLREAAEVQNIPQMDAQKCLDELKRKLAEKRREKQLICKTIESKTKDCEALEVEIGNFTSNLSRIEQEKLERLREMKSLEEKARRIESVLETTENDVFQMKSNVKRKADEERDLQRELLDINNKYSNVQENLATLQSETNNSYLLYGRDMPRVIAAIEANKHKFTQMPRGPLGAYVSIIDKKWAIAIEGFLGPALLHAFVVDNRKDNMLLMNIFKSHWMQGTIPMIITTKFFSQVHDVSSNLVPSVQGCVSVYEAIDVSDPIVLNCLIDQIGLESVLLIPTTDKAIELMSEAKRVPRHCKQGVTIKGDKYYPDPNYKTYASQYHQSRLLQVNTSDLISQYNDKLALLNEKRETVQNQFNAIRADKNEQNRALTELTTKFEKLKKANNIAKRKLDDFKSADEPECTNINSLETELNEIKKDLLQRNVDAEKVEQELNEIKAKIIECDERLNKLIQANQAFEDRIVPLEQQVIEQSNKKKELNVGDNFEKKRAEDLRKQLEPLQSELTEMEKNLNGVMTEANKFGERLLETRDVAEVLEEITRNDITIATIKADSGSLTETARQYNKTREITNATADLMHALFEDIKELEYALKRRTQYYKNTEDFFINYLNHNFIRILEFRQFKGEVKIKMKEKTLDLVVIPQQGTQGHTAVSNLSGGERSYSTVSFLYALWQCMEFPFYFLDEFDVFMDPANRAKMMEILIHHAKKRPHLQFVFLTPQDVSFIHDDAVALTKLGDPKRMDPQ